MAKKYTFPKDFVFSVATSAYQIEGAANFSGRGPSIWDKFSHTPGKISDGNNGDIACDHYHKYKEDVRLLKDLGVHEYRFSFSWPRILPAGTVANINLLGVEFYQNLIDELIRNDIQPTVTLYHWDLPLSLMDQGGFLNRQIVHHFGEYARFCYETFGDRVKKWITFNEPTFVIQAGYGGLSFDQAPGGFRSHGEWAQYLAGHHLLLAHAEAVEIYRKEFQQKQQGKIGIALGGHWCIPHSDSQEDIDAARRELMFTTGWFAQPIFGQHGDYPKEMKECVLKRSEVEGRVRSRLPEFGQEEIRKLKGSADFLGVNYYVGKLVRHRKNDEYADVSKCSISELDAGVVTDNDPSWMSVDPPDGWIYHNSQFMRPFLNFFRQEYNNPVMLITEVGCMDTRGEGLDDVSRIRYVKDHIIATAQAIEDGCNIIGYTHWSLMDNFEWAFGFSLRFGLYHVDFEDPGRKRTPKASVEFFKKVIQDRYVEG